MVKEINKLVKKVNDFEKKADFEDTSIKTLTSWLKKEIKEYENAKTKSKKANKLTDIIILVIQIAKREGINLDQAWKKWFEKSKKYYKK